MRAPTRITTAAAVAAGLALGGASAAAASHSVSHAVNFQTASHGVFCGIAMRVRGTILDPGVQAPLSGFSPGLQCSARGIPRPAGPPANVGDPFIQLGRGRAGRARIVLESQDDLVSSAAPVTLTPGERWNRDGISCTVTRTTVTCDNGHGHGFQLRPGHVGLT